MKIDEPSFQDGKFPPLDNVTYSLFNLSVDENEHKNIVALHPAVVDALLSRVKEITGDGQDVACMDCPDQRCPNAKTAQVNVSLPNGEVVKAWEPYCDEALQEMLHFV